MTINYPTDSALTAAANDPNGPVGSSQTARQMYMDSQTGPNPPNAGMNHLVPPFLNHPHRDPLMDAVVSDGLP